MDLHDGYNNKLEEDLPEEEKYPFDIEEETENMPLQIFSIPRASCPILDIIPEHCTVLIHQYLDLKSSIRCLRIKRDWSLAPTPICFQVSASSIYLGQSRRKQLKLTKWGSFYSMLFLRPRVLTDGVYLITNKYIKKPERDMWSTIEPGTVFLHRL